MSNQPTHPSAQKEFTDFLISRCISIPSSSWNDDISQKYYLLWDAFVLGRETTSNKIIRIHNEWVWERERLYRSREERDEKIKELEEQITKMKNCTNCSGSDGDICHERLPCKNYDAWKIKE